MGNRIHVTDKTRALAVLVAINRVDLACEYEKDVDEEDTLGDARLIIEDDIVIERGWIKEQTVFGAKDVAGYTVRDRHHHPDSVIATSTSLEEAVLLAVYEQMQREMAAYMDKAQAVKA